MAEFIRAISQMPMEEAGRLIDQVQMPIGGLVEDFGDKKLVLAELVTRDEILVLLHSSYPNPVATNSILVSLDRRKPETVRKNLRILWNERLAEGSGQEGYTLTRKGVRTAIDIISRVCEETEP
jgi:hypothetical protein